MSKTILITGATDGLGLATAKLFASKKHRLLLHGRNAAKLEAVVAQLSASGSSVKGYLADLSRLDEVEGLAAQVVSDHERLDVLINNAGVFKTNNVTAPSGRDLRFEVNTLAPYLLTRRLLHRMTATGRVVNLSSAAQSPVQIATMLGPPQLSDFEAYAQSKLAITMWTAALAAELGDSGPSVIAVNPGSLLATKMVEQAFGKSRAGVEVGADILARAALSEEFSGCSGAYFDNDAQTFAQPHPSANPARSSALMAALHRLVETIL